MGYVYDGSPKPSYDEEIRIDGLGGPSYELEYQGLTVR
jgi:hypothetical protein